MVEFEDRKISLKAIKGEVTIHRNDFGVPVVQADNYQDMMYGLGWVHAYDRPLQLELTRLVAKGMASEHLPPSPELLKSDIYMRRYELWGFSVRQAERLDAVAEGELLDYCRGINDCLKENRPPEFELLDYQPQDWTPADCIVMVKIITLVDMDETQAWMKRFIVQMVQNEVPLAKLKELFVHMTDEPSPEYMDILRRVKLPEPFKFSSSVPRMQSSSNWAVSGSLTRSGKAMLCGSPDLDSSRLPAIWQEVVLRAGDYYIVGFSMPGLMLPIVARTRHMAWSPTYGCMDIMDYFIEEVEGGKYRRGDQWLPFEVREEVIKVKDGDPVTVRFFENEHGVLEGEPKEDGYYLCLAWSMRDAGAATVENYIQASRCTRVSDAMGFFSRLDFGDQNWVMADSEGNIGYAMSGICPIRPKGWSGLLPLPGWDETCDWMGYHDPGMNPRLYNPLENYIATANQEMNHLSDVVMQSLPMSGDRSSRIAELLEARDDHDIENMKAIQFDIYAKHAEQYMPLIRPLLPDTPNGNLLRDWNLVYEPDSLGASLFEEVYLELVRIVFGDDGMGRGVVRYILGETILFNLYYGHFDQVLVRKDSLWFEGKSRDDLFRLAIERGLNTLAVPYGITRRVLMKNIVYGDITPDYNYGPIEIRGNRGTISQGQIFTTAGNLHTFSPTIRMITDFAEDKIHTTLAGGPCEKPASPWYTSGVQRWLDGTYDELEPQ